MHPRFQKYFRSCAHEFKIISLYFFRSCTHEFKTSLYFFRSRVCPTHSTHLKIPNPKIYQASCSQPASYILQIWYTRVATETWITALLGQKSLEKGTFFYMGLTIKNLENGSLDRPFLKFSLLLPLSICYVYVSIQLINN